MHEGEMLKKLPSKLNLKAGISDYQVVSDFFVLRFVNAIKRCYSKFMAKILIFCSSLCTSYFPLVTDNSVCEKMIFF